MAQRSRTLSEIHFDASDHVAVYTTQLSGRVAHGLGRLGAKIGAWIVCCRCGRAMKRACRRLDMSYRDQVVARLRQRAAMKR